VTGMLGGGIVGCGLLTCLVIADMPLALATAAMFGLMGSLGAWMHLRDWRRSRTLRFRLRVLRDRLRAVCTRPRWTKEETAALEDDRALRRLLKAMPEVHREGKLR
jgi:hypothetical protein